LASKDGTAEALPQGFFMAAGRSVWSGFVRFGLVSVPVKAYTAAVSGGGGIALHQLHHECGSRIQYKKTCPIHGEVKPDEIVSGYEFAKGQYVVIEPDELEKMRTPNEKAIDVKAFIKPDEIDARYYNGKTWFLVPDGAVGVKPYALLYKTLEEQGLVAFAQVVVAGKEQLLLLRPNSNLLVGSYISYAQDMKTPADFKDDAPHVEVTPAELKLAKTLTDAMKVTDFDLSQYKDDYTEKMTQLIQAKVEGKEVVVPPAEEAPQVINLMDALKKSLEQAKKAAGGKPAKLAAPSVGAARETRKRKTS
jgi:DNA end-binding protein Ku